MKKTSGTCRRDKLLRGSQSSRAAQRGSKNDAFELHLRREYRGFPFRPAVRSLKTIRTQPAIAKSSAASEGWPCPRGWRRMNLLSLTQRGRLLAAGGQLTRARLKR